ncbi:MAG: EamA family transporter [Parasporobacterium sp.]|nr:EamA family transporter [Parasporobacterium sp.]
MNKDKLKMIAAMAIFGTIGLARRYVPYSSVLIVCVRAVIGLVVFLAIKLIRREKFDKALIKKNLVYILLSGAALVTHWVILFEAYNMTTVSVACVCNYMAPIILILVSPFLFKEKITLQKGLCAFFALLGLVFISGVIETGFTGISGALLALLSAFLYAFIIVMNRKMTGLTAADRTLFQFAVSVALIVPYSILTGQFEGFQFQTGPCIMLVILGLVHTGLAYYLYFGSLYKIPAQTVAIFAYIDPVMEVILSALVLQEEMSALAVIGAVLVIGSAVISEIKFVRKAA